MFLVTDLSGKFPHTTKLNDTKDVRDAVIGITGDRGLGDLAETMAGYMTFGNEFVCQGSFKLCCVTDDEARAWVEKPLPASMGQKLNDIIAAHNRMIETIQNAGMTCNLFRGMEVWHKIACEGADITHAARSIGIDATVNMQSGVITVQKGRAIESNELTLTELIRNLEDQLKDRESSVDDDDPECIFRRDAAALRTVLGLLRRLEAQA